MSVGLEIEIKTKAELEGFKQAISSLERQIGAAKAAGKAYGDLESQLKRANDAVNRYNKSSFSSSLDQALRDAQGSKDREIIDNAIAPKSKPSGLLSGVNKTVGMASAALGASGLIKSAINEAATTLGLNSFNDYEKALKGVNAALAQTGQFTVDYSRKLEDLASTLQETTGISDDAWLNVIRRLTQFGATDKDINKHIEAVKNLAGIMGGDLDQAATAVSKAMLGNYDQFRRQGIVISDTGTQAEKLARLYSDLSARGGGQLKNSIETISGSVLQAANSLEDFGKSLWSFLASFGIIQKIFEGWGYIFKYTGQGVDWLTQKLTGGYKATDDFNNASKKTVETLTEQTEVTRQTAKVQQEFEDSLKRSKNAQEETSDAIKQNAEGDDKVMEALKDRELARIDFLEKTKLITAENAIVRRTQLEQKAADDRIKREADVAMALNAIDQKYVFDQVKKEDELSAQLEAVKSGKKKGDVKILEESFQKTKTVNLDLVMDTDRRMRERNRTLDYSFAEHSVRSQTRRTTAITDLASKYGDAQDNPMIARMPYMQNRNTDQAFIAAMQQLTKLDRNIYEFLRFVAYREQMGRSHLKNMRNR